jgi:hypothetical protein
MSEKVFISHSNKDFEIARKFKEQFEMYNFTCYIFEFDKKPGEDVTQKIQAALDGANQLIVLITPDGGASSYVQQEIGYAEAKGIEVIPLVQDGVKDDHLGMLKGREYITLDPANVDKTASEILNFLLHKSKVKSDKKVEELNNQLQESKIKSAEITEKWKNRMMLGSLILGILALLGND